MGAIKLNLNHLAKWLYKKTRCAKDIPNSLEAILGSTQVYENEFLPKGTMYIGTSEKTQLEIWGLDKEIMMEKRQVAE